MGVCGTQHYDAITRDKMDLILKALRDNGATISGDNPWHVDTRRSGVKLRGVFTESAARLSITVVDSSWYAPCSSVWNAISDMMRDVQRLPDTQLEAEI
jgi:hypothetical protein